MSIKIEIFNSEKNDRMVIKVNRNPSKLEKCNLNLNTNYDIGKEIIKFILHGSDFSVIVSYSTIILLSERFIFKT